MKKVNNLKLNILQIFIVFFTFTICLFSCTNEHDEVLTNNSAIENLNTESNRQVIKSLFNSENGINEQIEQLGFKVNASKTTLEEIDLQVLLIDYMECSECPLEYKNFLHPFFQEIIKINNNQIIPKIEQYEALIEDTNLNNVHKDNLRFVLFSFKEASKYTLSNLKSKGNENRDPSTGTNIGRGLAWGFLSGCATGAYIGGTAGTVTVPLIGTVTGAVAGCIAGGAWASVVGATGAGIWSSVDAYFK